MVDRFDLDEAGLCGLLREPEFVGGLHAEPSLRAPFDPKPTLPARCHVRRDASAVAPGERLIGELPVDLVERARGLTLSYPAPSVIDALADGAPIQLTPQQISVGTKRNDLVKPRRHRLHSRHGAVVAVAPPLDRVA